MQGPSNVLTKLAHSIHERRQSHNNKGCTLQRLDKFDVAIECFDAAESIQAGLFEISNNKAISLIALGNV